MPHLPGLRKLPIPILAAAVAALIIASPPDRVLALDNVVTPDANVGVGEDSSLELDSSGNPVVSYRDASNNLIKLLHCNDPRCVGGGESITSPISGIVLQASLALDTNDNPVISYLDGGSDDLRLMHCNDPNCAGGDESDELVDGASEAVGHYSSLSLDSNGYPVISHTGPTTNPGLKIVHCNDANCDGEDESIVLVDTQAGQPTSLALNNDKPVVAYIYFDGVQSVSYLKVMTCNDVNCAGFDGDTFAHFGIGSNPSLVLDADANPVLSYNSIGGLTVAHCNDASCQGAAESVEVVDPVGATTTSIALDNSGFPVVAYRGDSGLAILRCNDVNCAGSGDTISHPDLAGETGAWASLELDSLDNPVVSYMEGGSTTGNLRLLHCDDSKCTGGSNLKCDGRGPTTTPGNPTNGPDVMILGSDYDGSETFGLGGSDRICGGASANTIYGGAGNDRIFGGGGNDELYGNGQDDFFDGGSGQDKIDGGLDNDTVSFPGNVGRTINLVSGVVSGEGSSRSLTSIENAKGSNGNDTITGANNANKLEGLDGKDTLKGGGAKDNLLGGKGADTLGGQGGPGDVCHGGDGADKFLGGSKAASGCENPKSIP